jgi:hypothetical protein
MVVHAGNSQGFQPDISVRKNDIISHKVSGTFCESKKKKPDQNTADIGENPERHAEVTKKSNTRSSPDSRKIDHAQFTPRQSR